MVNKRRFNLTANWVLAIIATFAVVYNVISIQVIASTDIKYIKADVAEIRMILFRYIIPGNADTDDVTVTDPPS